nr:hypothetical protein [uncultured Bacteroides sp.]
MKTKDFFTTEFYKNPDLTLDVLNQLIQQKQVADIEMYDSGTFFYMCVHDNDESRSLLSQVISDFDAYKGYNDECFACKCSEFLIVLCALHDEHSSFFRSFEGCKEIKWDREAGAFLFAEDMPSKFE